MRSFAYHRPKTLKEAISLLGKHGGKAALLAGGTGLLVDLIKRTRSLSQMIDIKRIPSLGGIGLDGEGYLHLGPLVTMQTLSTSPFLVNGLSLLAKAARKVGSWQIRNRATIGGNICQAYPSSDPLPALLCLDAELKLQGLDGERVIRAEDFFVGPGKPVLGSTEILTEILIPPMPAESFGIYKKFALRKAMDLPMVGVAAVGTRDSSRKSWTSFRIGLGAVAPTPLRAKKAENLLNGRRITKGLIAEAASLAATEARPLSDNRGAALYRQEMIRHLFIETIQEVLAHWE